MRTLNTLPALVLCLASPALPARPLQVEDLFKARRVADPQIVAGIATWQVGTVDLEANRTVTRLWMRRPGEAARELDLGAGSQSRPRLSPDGKRLAYQSGGQIWVLDLATGTKLQLTKLSGGASGQVWSPDGSTLAFTSTTVPSGTEEENAAYLKGLEESKVKARHSTTLMYRHWDAWRDPNQVSHLFVVKADGSEAPRDLTPGWRHDIPNASGTDAGDGYAWSPDGKTLAFSSHPEFEKAVSTNGEIYEVALAGGAPRRLSDNPAMDCTPRFSPCGKYLAWRAQRRPGFEADKWEIWVLDRATGKVVHTTKDADLTFQDIAWNGPEFIATAPDAGRDSLYRWTPGSRPERITKDIHLDTFALAGGKALAVSSSLAAPSDLVEVDLKTGATARFTTHNEALEKDMALDPGEDLWVTGGAGKDGKAPKVQAWVIKPADFDPARKYPVAFVIHGGPQGAWNAAWHPRWNGQAWAGRGFITVLPNPRGSHGFGQKFCDEISKDWNGLVMKDLMAVLDGVLKKFPNADPKKVIAAGGSYGGYATNWLAGHKPERFAAFVSHASIFNTESMQLGTEELWFPRWEFKGWPWESPQAKARWTTQSPLSGAANFKKPMLVIHGELDYRVPVTEAYALFNVHQLKGVPSELLVFPDENHFVAKPQNSRLWYETVLGWCERWTK